MSEKPLPGFYYMGFVTNRSIKSMPPLVRAKFRLGTPLSNTRPKATSGAAHAEARAHFLRDVTVWEETGKEPA